MNLRKALAATAAALTLAALTACSAVDTKAVVGDPVEIVHVTGTSGILEPEPVEIVHVTGSAGILAIDAASNKDVRP